MADPYQLYQPTSIGYVPPQNADPLQQAYQYTGGLTLKDIMDLKKQAKQGQNTTGSGLSGGDYSQLMDAIRGLFASYGDATGASTSGFSRGTSRVPMSAIMRAQPYGAVPGGAAYHLAKGSDDVGGWTHGSGGWMFNTDTGQWRNPAGQLSGSPPPEWSQSSSPSGWTEPATLPGTGDWQPDYYPPPASTTAVDPNLYAPRGNRYVSADYTYPGEKGVNVYGGSGGGPEFGTPSGAVGWGPTPSGTDMTYYNAQGIPWAVPVGGWSGGGYGGRAGQIDRFGTLGNSLGGWGSSPGMTGSPAGFAGYTVGYGAGGGAPPPFALRFF